MIDRKIGARAQGGSRAWLLGVALAFAPLAGGCVSAVDDSSAFGFAGGTTVAPEPAATETAAAGGDAAATEAAAAPPSAEAADDAVGRRIAAAAAGADGTAVAQAQAQAPAGEASSRSPFLANTASIAAFSGGTVTGGGEARPAAENRTMFGSLFASAEPRTPLANADRTRSRRVVLQREGAPLEASSGGGDSALPGVDPSSLFEIGQRTSLDDEEYMEDTGVSDGSFEVASLTGMARLAPNGLLTQREDVVTQCFEPKLVGLLRSIERRFGKKVVVTSGYRSPTHNRRVNGARHSQHMACKAADILVPGVDRFELANFARTLPGRGGVGTYCHTAAVHVDVGRQRDWNWGCRRRG